MAQKILTGKVALVTGASRGMGREMADAIIEAGGCVGLMSPDEAELRHAVAEITEARGTRTALALPYDISDYAQCEKARDEMTASFGGIDILVNNAALGQLNVVPEGARDTSINFWETDPERWAEVIRVNVVGTYFMCRALAPSMIARGWGRIVNITTSLGTIQRQGNAPYGPSKGAIEAETLIFAKELKGTGVTCNSLIPGGAAATAFVPKNFLTERELVAPEIMRAPIVWLVSEAAASHTGARFVANRWDLRLPPADAAKAAMEPPVYRVPERDRSS